MLATLSYFGLLGFTIIFTLTIYFSLLKIKLI